MRIATWNINSVRTRTQRALNLISKHDIDVLCLQETKVKDDKFPREPFEEAGLHVTCHGLNQWNGVAIVSRVGLDDVSVGFPDVPGFGDPASPEARAIGATCGGVRVWSLYVPNGRTLDDPHMAYKLDWLQVLRTQTAAWRSAEPGLPLALCGDFNVAPQDDDVWDMAAFEGSTHVSEPERAAFRAFLDDGLVDVVRPHAPGPGVYTYWDYQQLRFPKKQGMRIDFVLATPALADRVVGAAIDREERKGKGASDHAPVVVTLD